jgi:hypothetical protein
MDETARLHAAREIATRYWNASSAQYEGPFDRHALWTVIDPLDEPHYDDAFRKNVLTGYVLSVDAVSGEELPGDVRARHLIVIGASLSHSAVNALSGSLESVRAQIRDACTDPRLLGVYDALSVLGGGSTLYNPLMAALGRTLMLVGDSVAARTVRDGLIALCGVVAMCGDEHRLREAEALAATGLGDGTAGERYRSLERVLRQLHDGDA